MASSRCRLKVRGLDCPAEIPAIRKALEGAPGVLAISIDPTGGTVEIEHDPEATGPDRLASLVTDRAGLPSRPIALDGDGSESPSPVEGSGSELADPSFLRRAWPTIGSGLALGSGALAAVFGAPGPVVRALWGLAIVVGGFEIFPRALAGLRRLRLDIHVLMALAVAGAVALGEWGEAATVAFLFGLSELLESLSLERARRAVRSLLEIAPETAEQLDDAGKVRVVPASELRAGDRVRVRAGSRVPIDGRVVDGRSSVDQKAITGESEPVPREPGDEVYAGTVNGEGALEVEASGPLRESVVSKVAAKVREAQANRAPTERTIERFAAYYTPMAVGFAALLAIVPPLVSGGTGFENWAHRALVVLVVACPCALVIGAPVASVAALAASARRGILVKGGQFLEAFGRIKTLAFDKTGTLTMGAPDVVEVVPVVEGEAGVERILTIAAALGDRGGHVLGRAIADHARRMALHVPAADGYRAVPGLGASGHVGSVEYHIGSHRYLDESGLCHPEFHESLGRAEERIGTSVALSTGSGPLGWLRLADRPRAEASRVVAALRSLGIEPVMLTGDNPPTALAIARELGIDDLRAGLMPADKATIVAELESQRGPVGMVGDGVNDAPALAAASVSVSLGGVGSAAALETADVVLMSDDLGGLPWLVRHGRRTRRVVMANIVIAVGAKLAFLLLAALGRADLWAAIVADVGVSLAVVANAMRLLKTESRPDRIGGHRTR